MTGRFRLITRASQWRRLAPVLAAQPRLALDLEGNGFFRYPERVCLIQVGLPRQVYLLDPFGLGDLSALGRILADPNVEKVFHSCENDLRALHRDFGFRVKTIFDTALAARMLGEKRLGLGHLLSVFLQVDIPKSKRLQRQDWTLRPLKPESLDYAAADVAHLLNLRRLLAAQVESAGRLDWLREELHRLEHIHAAAQVPAEDLVWNVKGSRTLPPRERTLLRELVLLRERLAREWDRPPFRVMSDDVLLALAKSPDQDLSHVKGLSASMKHRYARDLSEAMAKGRRGPVIPLPQAAGGSNRRRGTAWQKRLAVLKAWREAKGAALDLDVALIWPLRHLEQLAADGGWTGHDHAADKDVRRWQRKAFGSEIDAIVEGWGSGRPAHETPREESA